MKLLYTIVLLLVIGCSLDQTKINNNYEKIDSIIQNSEINIIRSDSINRESEKAINEKINQTIAKIENLKEEARVAKLSTKTVMITKVDTVYIETKKNFWGKTRKSTTIKSDSTIVEDSTSQN